MQKKFQIKPFIPFFLILLTMVAGYCLSFLHPPSREGLKLFHAQINEFHADHPLATPFLFMAVYILYALFSLPGIFILSLIAGFLFTQPFSTLYVTIGATIGGSLLFLAARSAFREFFLKRSGRLIRKLEQGFRNNAASYLLFLRLIPLFPFWIVNLAGAFFGVSFRIFAFTTLIGMIPSAFIYTQAGTGFSLLLENPNPLNPLEIFNMHLIIGLAGLALLSLLPLLFYGKNSRTNPE